MEMLFDNPLSTMYGPYFLVLYAFVIVFTVLALLFKKNSIDKTDRIGMPPIPSQIDPFEIAYLRGGNNELARSVIFSLLKKQLIAIDKNDAGERLKPALGTTPNDLKPIERIALDWLGKSREISELFGRNGLTTQLKGFADAYDQRLSQNQLLVSDEARSEFKKWKATAYAVILGFGIYKITAALLFGRWNVLFIILFAAVGVFIVWAASKLPRLTSLGKAYLQRLQLAFENLRAETQKIYHQSNNHAQTPAQTTFAGVDPLLLTVGVFGGSILAGTMYDHYNQTFQKAHQHSAAASGSSCAAGCGSGCSSGSDSGGSSCSSCGSSCGGGCGGCGG